MLEINTKSIDSPYGRGNALKLRESLIRSILLSYIGNCMMAIVNHNGYSKKV